MLILTLEAQKHLDGMSELDMNSILEWIGNQPPINPFVVYCGYMYFFKGEKLVCVKLQEENGVFVMWFDGQIIEFNRMTGNCLIVSFSRNCLEYFSVGNHYQNATPRVCCFLYRLLTQQRINRVGGRTIHSLRIFFTPTKVVGHIESAGMSTLRPPTDCLSLHEMICGIKQFLMAQISSFFLRRLFIQQLPVLGQTRRLSSVAGNYALRMFYNTTFEIRPQSVAMISTLFLRLCPFHSITRTNHQTRILMGFLRNISGSPIFGRILLNFTQNPIGLRQGTGDIDNLLQSYRLKSRLDSCGFPHSIRNCVQNMSAIVDQRKASYEMRFEKQMSQAPDFNLIKKKNNERFY